MQLKMQDIVNFPVFYEAVKSQKLSMKIAYRLAQLSKAIDGELCRRRLFLHGGNGQGQHRQDNDAHNNA